MKKNDLYMISGTEYKEMTKEILAQSDLWAEIKKKADQKQKNADQMLIGIKPNLVSPTEASYGATTHPEIVAGIIEYLQERSCQHIVMLESSCHTTKNEPRNAVNSTFLGSCVLFKLYKD